MRIRLKRMTMLLSCITVLFCIYIMSANAYTYPKMPSNWMAVRVNVGSVTMPFDSYPAGAYFDPNKSTMTAEEQQQYGFNLGRTLDLRGNECVAFARYAYAALFYKFPQDASIDTNLAYSYGNSYAYINMIEQVLGTKTLAPGYSAATLKNLFTSCMPGAVMRVDGHSMVLMAIFDDGCIIYDANFSSSNAVGIRKYTWDSFVSSFGGRTMTALHMPKYYPGYSYSTGGSSDGYDVDFSKAGTYTVTSSELNVRTAPYTSATRVGSLKEGDEVQVLGAYNGWGKIDYQNVWRWVSMDYLKAVTEVTVTFDPKGGTASYTKATYQAGSRFGSLPTAEKKNRTFAGWTDGSTVYTQESTVPATSKLALRAGWCILEFQDVREEHWFASYVEDACNMGLISRDTLFNPDQNTSRCQLVTVLGREYERETGSTASGSDAGFKDVPANSYYAAYVNWGTETGIVKGVGGNSFDPDSDVTREQVAAFLYRYALYRGVAQEGGVDASLLAQFKDGATVSDYAVNAVSWAVSAGILKGDDQGCMNPRSPAARCEMVTMFSRYIAYADAHPVPVKKTVTITFDAAGGTASEASRSGIAGDMLGTLPTAEKKNRTLVGWFSGNTQYTADSVIPAESITLTARWSVLGYRDVIEGEWYVPFIEDCAAHGMLETAETFAPNQNTTRGEVVAMLGHGYEKQTGTVIPAAAATVFQDVDLSQDYGRYVVWGYDTGIVKGTSETRFAPDSFVTRAQLVTFLYRMACYSGIIADAERDASNLMDFADGAAVSADFRKAMSWAVESGILAGDDLNRLNPEGTATHAELVTVMSRYLQYTGVR